MSYEFLLTGRQRFTQQGFLTPTATAIRVFSVYAYSTSVNGIVTLADRSGGTTATGAFTDLIAVPMTTSATTYVCGEWSDSFGVRFNDGVFLETSAGFQWAVVNYLLEK